MLFVVVVVIVVVCSTRSLVLDFSACSFCCGVVGGDDEWAELGDRCLVVLGRCMWCMFDVWCFCVICFFFFAFGGGEIMRGPRENWRIGVSEFFALCDSLARQINLSAKTKLPIPYPF